MMSFQGKYEILSALSDGESQSFRALQISSGRPVLVHHLAASGAASQQPDLASLIFKFLRGASAEARRNFLDMGEADGRIFVVTADVPECLNLRQWLQSVTEAQAEKEGDAQPAGEGAADLRSPDMTRDFTTRAMRQVSRPVVSEPASPSVGPSGAPTAVPVTEKSPSVLKPAPEAPAASSEVTDRGPTEFSGSRDKSPPGDVAEYPASMPTSPSPLKGGEGPSVVPEVTADFLSRRSSWGLYDAPTEAMPTLQSRSADRERAPASAAVPAEASKLPPQPTMPPVADFPETQTPRELTGLLLEKGKVPLQAAASPSTAPADSQQEEVVKLGEKVPRRQLSMGFEVVFQSSRPRSRPTLSGAPNQSGIMTGPMPPDLRTGSVEAAPTLPMADLPKVPPPVSPGAERIAGSTALSSPPAPAEPRQAVEIRKEPLTPPPPAAREGLPQPEKPTRLVPTPPSPPGEYTRMIENVKAVAGPLPPVAPPAGNRPAAIPAVSAPAPIQASYLQFPAAHPPSYREAPPQSRPSLYVAKDAPSLSPGRKRKAWVPVLILCSLLLMTVALLLFFAFKP